jgi:uncharacterized membrane protein YedE/YeeE
VKTIVTAFFVGLTFAVGLAISGMTQPSKVIGFLDFFGSWDPSLAFVMGGAIGVYLPLFHVVKKRELSLLGLRMGIPTRKDITPRLVGGSVLFGVGWGLAGFCPGPGIVSISTGSYIPLVFVVSMLAGMLLFKATDQTLATASRAIRGTP